MCAKKKKEMIYDHDEWLEPYKEVIDRRHEMILDLKDRLSVGGSLAQGMNNHMYYGLHRNGQGNWVFREWAPNATKIYNFFHCEECFFKCVTYCKSAVVLKKECVMILDVRHKGIRNFHCGRCTVFASRNVADRKNSFGKDVFVKRNACNSESCSYGRVSMYNCVYVGTFLVNTEVHFDFGGGVESAFDLVAFAVDTNDHIGCKVAFGYACRCAIVFVVANLNGDVTVVSSYEAIVIDFVAYFAYFLFNFER